jgi:phage-related protein
LNSSLPLQGGAISRIFLKDLSLADKVAILVIFEEIREFGFNAIGCQFRQIEGKLWEIKIKTKGGGWRFFYICLAHEHIFVLHQYKKQGQKAPKKELDMARKRLKEFLR